MGGEIEPPVQTLHYILLRLKEEDRTRKTNAPRTARKPAHQSGVNREAYAYAPLATMLSREEREAKVRVEEEANIARLNNFLVK